MAYIICKNCGCQMSDKSEACPVCGTLVEENATEKRDFSISYDDKHPKSTLSNQNSKKRNRILLIGIALIAVSAIVTTILIVHHNNQEKKAAEQLRIKHQVAAEQAKKQNKEQEAKDKIKKQILDAYRNGTIHNLMTNSFKNAEKAAMEAQSITGDIYFDADIFYNTQDEFPDKIDVPEVLLIGNDTAYVKVKFIFKNWGGNRVDSTGLIVVRNKQVTTSNNSNWLVDDIVGYYEDERGEFVLYSEKKEMNEFAAEASATSRSQKYVFINANELRLRYGPSLNSQTLRWADGKERYANRGDMFLYLGETDEFYKIDYSGSELWVSKKYTYLIDDEYSDY